MEHGELAESAAQRSELYWLLAELVLSPPGPALIERLSPNPRAARHWADLAQSLGVRARRGKAVNLDPAALLMDMVLKIDDTAGSLAQRV